MEEANKGRKDRDSLGREAGGKREGGVFPQGLPFDMLPKVEG